ncbi:MAG TPA: 3-hydroxyacyl-CoA dehydrogenase NAD-binding domain-containing protein [Syntrophobacteraceae bacterium]|nr:3-hydroxyacyl-CoA dehydrogenase NAD-binding domain-containing protein [Syntrophobacteraceae bacterium]
MSEKLKNVAIIGSGWLGAQIALIAAYGGFRVKIFDQLENAFSTTFDKLKKDLISKNISPFIPWDRWEGCRAAVQQAGSLDEAVADAQFVIEAAPENVELKNKIFAELGGKAPPEAIFATNSSSIPVSKLEASSGRPERCLNIHFYFPLQGVNMVDIMGGTKTLPEVFQAGVNWIKSVGFIPLKVNKEILGFCFNRIWRAIKRETLYMWGNGFVDYRDSDRGWMVFTGMNEGPFAIMDKVGLDVVYDIEMVYYNESGDPKDKPPDALFEKVKRGELGVKSGRGFYSYPNPEYLEPDFLKG